MLFFLLCFFSIRVAKTCWKCIHLFKIVSTNETFIWLLSWTMASTLFKILYISSTFTNIILFISTTFVVLHWSNVFFFFHMSFLKIKHFLLLFYFYASDEQLIFLLSRMRIVVLITSALLNLANLITSSILIDSFK